MPSWAIEESNDWEILIPHKEDGFKLALQAAFQFGGENNVKHIRKSAFGAILPPDVKEQMSDMCKVPIWDNFTECEMIAFLFAYCAGWNSEHRL